MPALTERPAPAMKRPALAQRPDSPVTPGPHSVPVTAHNPAVEIIQPYEQFANRRIEPRFDYNGRGCLLVLSRNENVPCRIVNQSASGAQILFDHIGDIPPELWLIDLDAHTAKRGRAAWSTPHKMGLKFNLIQTLSRPRPPKVPEDVYRLWLSLSQDRRSDGTDDVFFLD